MMKVRVSDEITGEVRVYNGVTGVRESAEKFFQITFEKPTFVHEYGHNVETWLIWKSMLYGVEEV